MPIRLKEKPQKEEIGLKRKYTKCKETFDLITRGLKY